ncbi:calcium-binding protein 8 isoform x1 [Limosa lapponica baueri]|uniref:Calcium-binding protein 8 isoform x1 n=1 Tax=Limosa lapponica baueri TaxID=1758121 RepID=A0A2I0TBV8_LIMLA|nr:calcium-binding protein 8 isoform x1 [Limosa lapponica baueri]
MPFHHVTAGLLYKGNYLNRSLSAGSDSEQLANISVEELDDISLAGLVPSLWLRSRVEMPVHGFTCLNWRYQQSST